MSWLSLWGTMAWRSSCATGRTGGNMTCGQGATDCGQGATNWLAAVCCAMRRGLEGRVGASQLPSHATSAPLPCRYGGPGVAAAVAAAVAAGKRLIRAKGGSPAALQLSNCACGRCSSPSSCMPVALPRLLHLQACAVYASFRPCP